MRGRKLSPLTILKGTRPGGGRIKHVHALTPMLPAPEYLSAEEKEVFETIREHAPHGLLGQIDRDLLAIFSAHVMLHRRAIHDLTELTFASRSTKKVHPLVAMANGQAAILLRLSESLGLTATVRQRIKLP